MIVMSIPSVEEVEVLGVQLLLYLAPFHKYGAKNYFCFIIPSNFLRL